MQNEQLSPQVSNPSKLTKPIFSQSAHILPPPSDTLVELKNRLLSFGKYPLKQGRHGWQDLCKRTVVLVNISPRPSALSIE